jgi:RNA polymerase sigma-70 factor (ECF subfamily)
MVGDYDTAVDLSQETFLKAFRNLSSYQSEYQFSTWIYKIATNIAIDRLRWRKRRGVIGRPTVPAPADAEEPSPEQLLVDTARRPDQLCMDQQYRKLIEEAVRSLPTRYRTVFVLKEMEELDYDHISKVLKCSVGTVKSRLHRAKNMLRKKLAPYWKSS